MIKNGHKRNETNYARLLEVLSELERKQDTKLTGVINDLKVVLEK